MVSRRDRDVQKRLKTVSSRRLQYCKILHGQHSTADNRIAHHTIDLYQPWYVTCRRTDI